MSKNNPYQNTRIEFHILQSFPVSCLNRDDLGAPKSALIGGVQRARVSSQCWKRAIRLAMHELGVEIAIRTRLVNELIQNECEKLGATPQQAKLCGDIAFWCINNGTANSRNKKLIEQIDKMLENASGNNKKVAEQEEGTSNEKEDKIPIAFLSTSELENIAKFFQENDFQIPSTSNEAKALFAFLEGQRIMGRDGLDIALFGRMAASLPTMNVEAAASFAHAISTHRVAAEVEFFTAIDDEKEKRNQKGSAHMGSLEFNSAVYYRYISLDLGQLYENLNGPEDMSAGIEAFVKALYIAVPQARQTTMAATKPWDYAKIFLRKGYRLQASFEEPVELNSKITLLQASKKALQEELKRLKNLSGSLFGDENVKEYEFGENLDYSIDNLADDLNEEIQKIVNP
ncbi:MAG: type I-E CRISPR-associated protein Cas7/Cse4/CasC [Planctomycetia bacterium]|nr:type I-E CRISPR-associated protein Cas7/Cse4/CasC [Planctomycetia bacterium]